MVLTNFVQLNQISDLSLGSEVALRGIVTYVSRIREKDLDIHFDLAPPGGGSPVICEIQNADEVQHGQPLQQASDAAKTVEVTGVLRIFPEHVYASAGPTLAHIFEIHPIREVKIDGASLDNITIDCPANENFATQESMHEIVIQDDGTMAMMSSGRQLNDNIKVKFDGTDLTMTKPPSLNVNYVFGAFYIFFKQNVQFEEGKPFEFELRGSNDPSSVPVRSVVVPGTPAYDAVKGLLDNPSSNALSAAGLRTLDFKQLMNSTYEVVFCPVFRFR